MCEAKYTGVGHTTACSEPEIRRQARAGVISNCFSRVRPQVVLLSFFFGGGGSIQPFGFTLYTLENALGSMGPNGWKWFDDMDSLRGAFWRAFREQTGLSEPQTILVKFAGKAGILIRYGTAYDSGFSGMIGVRDPNAEDFRYLDAFLF